MAPVSLGVLDQQESRTAPVGSVGAKAATLARLANEGIPVPEFFVVPSLALSAHLEANGIAWPGPRDAAVEELREELRAAPIPTTVSTPVLDAYDRLCVTSGHPTVAVRSSGAEEDSAGASFAGQFASVLGVQGHEALLEALKECWASYLSPKSLRYRAQRGFVIGPEPHLAVIIQVQVFSMKSGVLFTVHPLEPRSDTACIEANFGTGDSVAGGLATPDTLTISRSDGEVVEAHIGTKHRMTSVSSEKGTAVVEVEDSKTTTAVLTDAEARELLRLGLRIEQLLGGPQDIEWAYDAAGRLWILQARPITALSSNGD
jgi:phosphoenolpyruvate synthase/pyruvate phosphate dikinase